MSKVHYPAISARKYGKRWPTRTALAAASAGISDVVKLTVLIVDHSESKLAR